MDNIAISGVISHDNLNTSGYISVYAFDNSTWLLTDTVSIRSGSAFLGATGPIVPTAFSLRGELRVLPCPVACFWQFR
jgi:hypothetical protein